MNDPENRASKLKIIWTEETCLNELAQQDHIHVATYEQRDRYERLWTFTQRHTGDDTTVTRQRDDHTEALVNFARRIRQPYPQAMLFTQSIPRKDLVHQRGAHSQQRRQQESKQADLSTVRPDWNSMPSDSSQNWWSSSSSSNCGCFRRRVLMLVRFERYRD